MSKHDEQLIAVSPTIRRLKAELQSVSAEERELQERRKRLVAALLAVGISARYIGTILRVSHVTVMRWAKEVDN